MQFIGIANTDSENRYGFRISPGAFVEDLWESSGIGYPQLINHDFARPIGWVMPLGLYLEPGLSCHTILSEIFENAEEGKALKNIYQHRLNELFVERARDGIQELRQHLMSRSGNDSIFYGKECILCFEQGIAQRVFPKIFEEVHNDKDELIDLKNLKPVGPGVFQIDDLLVFAHRYFRRTLFWLNSLNWAFLSRLQELDTNKLQVKIALDPDLVGLASTYNGFFHNELQYWWGPKFNDELVTIQSGVTRHQADRTDAVISGISATEFRWGSNKGQHIFEVEELRELDVPTAPIERANYGCRYVHTIVNEDDKKIIHFDGAIRMYTEETFLSRVEADLAHTGHASEYKKLWRVDGDIALSDWKSLLSDYFRDNHLVGEYLGGSENLATEDIPSHKSEETVQNEYVPYSMQPSMGIRVALSYHPWTYEEIDEQQFVTFDSITVGDERNSVVEIPTLELKKILQRKGIKPLLSNDVRFVLFKDRYINLPLIVHSSNLLSQKLSITLEAIKLYVDKLVAENKDCVLSFSLGLPFDEKEARLSFLGHVSDLNTWLTNTIALPPVTQADMRSWIEKVVEFLKENYPPANQNPYLFSILMETGILSIRRQPIQGDLGFFFDYSKERGALGMFFKEQEDFDFIQNIQQEWGVLPAPAYFVFASRCTHCNQEYLVCECSKTLDPDTSQELTEVKTAGYFWTDRHSW